ncbi:hypothetical protein M758_5G166000 [Ceratodon purpureus]|nr:hypothetical protein M758_5G166000 [Ceratodon purpureus]
MLTPGAGTGCDFLTLNTLLFISLTSTSLVVPRCSPVQRFFFRMLCKIGVTRFQREACESRVAFHLIRELPMIRAAELVMIFSLAPPRINIH